MQPPPISEYRPGGYSSGEFAADKVIGIILMILNTCGVLGGLMLLLGAGALGPTIEVEGKAISTAGLGLLGGIVLVMSALGIVVGYGIMKSLKWGFIGGAVVFAINTISNVVQLRDAGAQGMIGLVIAAAGAVYCILRLTGGLGPKPV